MPLESIGSYQLVELLGSGAMGEVYKATDGKMFDRVVAVKLLSDKFARNENARSRFRNEVQYAAHLDHPNIVKIYDHGEIEGRPFFVMEFLDGIDLAKFMKDEPNRSMERCVEIARQLCEALDFAHRHNVVHRDVKPANVMILHRGGSEQVKLVDFGIIHVESSKMTRDGTQPGTSAYSSPEQLRNDPLDHRSDLFSLGIVLYELFTNVYPFEAPSEALITHHILQREPDTPRKKNATIPAAVDVLILKLLEKDPAQRPQTAGEVAEALRQQHRKLQSRWASTDPAEYENLDEITREAVDKLVAWARQKEAADSLQEALDAYEKALKLAPDSDRIQRRIPKLRHRIESERLLKEHLGKATAALAAGHFPEARDHWKNAWILSPESEDVAALELRIEQAEHAVPDGRERRQFVEDLVARAQESLDAGKLDEARAEVVKILQRYPKDPLANFMLERILTILMAGVDYASYRRSIREARELLDNGGFTDARARCAQAEAVWPGDEEVASVIRDIDERLDGEVAALATRVEKHLLRADDPDLEETPAFELLAAIRADIAKARELGSGAAWIGSSSDEAERVERSIHERVARAEAFRREQDDQRRKRIDMFLQRGRNQIAEADVLAGRVTTEPAPAIEAYGLARESFDRVLQDDATHAETLEARRQIEEKLRDLAARVDRSRAEERELGSALEAARAAVAETEIAGGARAADLGAVTALLYDADVALDRVLSVDPRHSDALPLRSRVTALRAEILKEQDRREDREREAQKEADRAKQKAEESERRRIEEELAKEQAAKDRERLELEEARRAEDLANEKRREEAADEARRRDAEAAKVKQPPAPASGGSQAPAVPPAVARKIAEFEKGLAKHRRLSQQGKAREATEIQKILLAQASSDPELLAMYGEAFPARPKEAGRRGLVWGAIAGVAVVGAAAGWFFLRPAPTSSTPSLPAEPIAKQVPPEPFATATPPPEAVPARSEPVAPTQEPPREAPAVAPSVEPPKPHIQTEAAQPTKPTPSKPTEKQEPKSVAVPPPKPEPGAPPVPAPVRPTPQPQAAASPEGYSRIRACLLTAAGSPVGAGYRVVFSVDGQGETETGSTDAAGCATLELKVIGSASLRPVTARGPGGESMEIDRPPKLKVYEGISPPVPLQVKLRG